MSDSSFQAVHESQNYEPVHLMFVYLTKNFLKQGKTRAYWKLRADARLKIAGAIQTQLMAHLDRLFQTAAGLLFVD